MSFTFKAEANCHQAPFDDVDDVKYSDSAVHSSKLSFILTEVT
jgi:hypothetical protein